MVEMYTNHIYVLCSCITLLFLHNYTESVSSQMLCISDV